MAKPKSAIVHSGTLPLIIRVHHVRHAPNTINVVVTTGKAPRARARATRKGR